MLDHPAAIPPLFRAGPRDRASLRDPAPTPRTLEWRGVRYSISPADPADPSRGLVCEPPVGGRIPGYSLRSEIQRVLQRTDPGVTLLFTDSARSAEIRRWAMRAPGAPAAARELARWPGEGDDAPAAAARPTAGVRPGHEAVEREVGLAILTAAHARRPLLHPGGPAWTLLRRDPGRYGLPVTRGPESSPHAATGLGALGTRQLIQDLVEDPAGPELLRVLWHTLKSMRVLDPDCGEGARLMVVVDVLAWLYEACQRQMRIWVDEIRLERRPRRAELLRDFRTVLTRAEGNVRPGVRDPAVRERLALETVLLTNVFGASIDADAAARCRAALVGRYREIGVAISDALPPEACAISVGDPAHGLGDRAALARALVGRRNAASRLPALLEEAEAIERADRFVRRMRLEYGAGRDSTTAGLRAVGSRRRALARELDAIAARAACGEGTTASARRAWIAANRPLHQLAEWPPAPKGRAFLVLPGG